MVDFMLKLEINMQIFLCIIESHFLTLVQLEQITTKRNH